jgi:hypothetical protein
MRSALFASVLALTFATFGCSKSEDPQPDSSPSIEAGDEQDLNQAANTNAAAVGRAAYAKLEPLAGKVTLGMLGEDSGTPCSASFRIGPAADLTDREVLRLFQFNVDEQLANDQFDFHSQSDPDFWQSFADSQDEAGAAAAKDIQAIFTSPDVTGLAVMIPADRVPFSATAFLVARMKDGSLLALRGGIGGMSL